MINELFQKEGRSIFSFKKGDIIIRLKPRIITRVQTNENLGISTEVQTGVDNSFRHPVKFLCIENNQIYFRSIEDEYIYKANLEEYGEDWAVFIVPDGLTIEDCL